MSWLFLMIFTVVFLFLVEILCILFKLTGLQDYKARFQVISILTGTGYTTKESELIMQHEGRRKLAQCTMILGYIGLATFIPFFMGLISDIVMKELTAKEIAILVTFAVVLVLGIRSKSFLIFIDNKIEALILKGRIKNNNHKNIYKVLTRSHGFGVYNILIEESCIVINKTLEESKLSENEIIVLNVDRGDEFIAFPTSKLKLKVGDNISIYGRIENIKRIFKI